MKYFDPGVDRKEFQSILISGKPVVGVAVSISAVSMSQSTVNLTLVFSNLSGLYATPMRPYVSSFCLSKGISDFRMKKIVLVPMMSGIPYFVIPSS